ncbi:MAG: hypothetical protein HQ510_06270 [Candidatus Marinimicrobia bacterium]|nr:hypothetical protein [Candidatus Neomarinimicrobiota bacterium]
MKIFISPVILFTLTVSLGFGTEAPSFVLSDNSSGEIRITLTNDYSVVDESDGQNIIAEKAGRTTRTGVPDLPIYSTFIQLQSGIAYQADYIILESTIYHGINLLPTKGISFDAIDNPNPDQPIQMLEIESHYPEHLLILSEPMVMRGIEVAQLEFIPFRYYPQTHELEVFEQVEIIITESGVRPMGISQQIPPSLAFEPLYKLLILNYEPQSRIEDYQQPAILYVCGGGSDGAITNPYFQQLVEWRRQKGYVVYTASTEETGSSNSQIKDFITLAYQTFDPSPEFVGLVGDVGGAFNVPTFIEQWSGYSGDGDMPYSQLDGDDLLPEVLVGRLSANNDDELAVISVKTIGYEKADHIDETGDDWYGRAVLVGHSVWYGLTTINTIQYIESVMTVWGMEDVLTGSEIDNYPEWMLSHLSEGAGYFNYQGYLGMSGFGYEDIIAATNFWMTPFVTIPQEGTGSFSYGTSIAESFLRAGTVTEPTGGVGAVGSSTTGQQALFNSIIDMGIYEGIFPKYVETTGAALAMGKLAMLHAYPDDPNYCVSTYSHWNNLMGDPAVHLWTLRPTALNVIHPTILATGSNFVDIVISEEVSGNPVEGARVVITDLLGFANTGFTNEDGLTLLDIGSEYSGDLTVTVIKKNCIPYQGNLQISDSGNVLAVNTADITIFESIGNNDGIVNPGETIQLQVPINNTGNNSLVNLISTLTSNSDDVEIISGISITNVLDVGATHNLLFVLSISNSAVHGDDLGLFVTTSDVSGNSWSNMIPVMVTGSQIRLLSYQVSNGGLLEPGMSTDFDILISNEGVLPTGELTVILNEMGPWTYFDIDDDQATFNSLSEGQSSYSLDGFHLTASEDIVYGSILNFTVHITSNSGYDKIEILSVQVGEVSVTDPVGSDSHGYYIYDSEDLGYIYALPYNWIEIDPDLGGEGVSLDLIDQGNGQPTTQQSAHVELPFIFTFYGVDYDEITISTNGWISPGHTEMTSFRNYELPGAGGPSPMIAAFWDDLKTSSGGQVYTFFDAYNNQMIVEWSGMHTYEQNSEETFQVILIADSITPTGDDEIQIQYKEFNNTSIGDIGSYPAIHGNYSTIGIENHLGNMGLQYTFNNQYPLAAMQLHDETSLFFTTRPPSSLLMGDVNLDSEINILDIVWVVSYIINLGTLSQIQQYIADLNEDEMVNVLDVILLINEILAQ